MAAFLGLFLVIRTIALEPFGVPTGSMSPALCGHHRDGFCPRCGATVRVGRRGFGSEAEHFGGVRCGNCEQSLSLADAPELSGDRLLVDKNVYDVRRPRRWEMVVFRCPNPRPEEFGKPYVKRLVGMPGETVRVVDGDVHADGALIRKDLPELRETLVPLFDMAFAPKAGGWGERWLVESGSVVIADDALVLDASEGAEPAVAKYRHWSLDARQPRAVRVWNPYNGDPAKLPEYVRAVANRRWPLPDTGPGREIQKEAWLFPLARDFFVSCELEVTAAGGDAAFELALSDGADVVGAELAIGRRGAGFAKLLHADRGPLGSTGGVALEPGRKYKLEFAFVDRRVTLAVDGRVVVPPADLDPPGKRAPDPHPIRKLAARGCRAVVRDLKLFRDLHYITSEGDHGHRPTALGPREYFVLGDNTHSSEDSRKWPTPGVPDDAFIGKPFLIHQPLRLSRVSVGGRERTFQALDWSRLRWLH